MGTLNHAPLKPNPWLAQQPSCFPGVKAPPLVFGEVRLPRAPLTDALLLLWEPSPQGISHLLRRHTGLSNEEVAFPCCVCLAVSFNRFQYELGYIANVNKGAADGGVLWNRPAMEQIVNISDPHAE